MPRIIIYLLIVPLFISCAGYNLDEINTYQTNLKNEWENPETTPLKEDEKDSFQGIQFFPIDKKYIVNADFTPIENGKTIPFPTSAQKIKHYKEYGKLNFKLNGSFHELTIYQSDPPIEGYENSLFLPFMDETNGDTSYGGGRYLDFEITDIQSNKLRIDFNKAYNPYCAYSKYYNCPIPPANNYLETEIKAGVSYLE
ncbi:MAG: DUF1684 domain-containing protein [Flavobacteriaceae bacterium]|jgi:uncharacterized protein (DUF1684 family)|nr:DUF1684 domain-containing protein [Flavobacteriaceae bacterium]